MLQWISANIGTVLISLVLLAVVTLIIRSMVHDKKQGKSSCGGNCAGGGAGGSSNNKCHSIAFPDFPTTYFTPQTLSADCISLCMF